MTVTGKTLSLLFPSGELAWRGMQNGSMSELSDGIAVQYERDRINGKNIVNDFYPSTTTLQKEWEDVFRLPSGEFLTAAQRSARLEASWSRIAPGSFDGTNEIYQLSGLNVIARPLIPGEDPRLIADEPTAVIMADGRPGIPETNYISVFGGSVFGQIQDSSRFGNFTGDRFIPLDITIPDDEWTWAMIYIIEGADGDTGFIPIELKDAFNFTTFKNKPHFMWAISRVLFTDIEANFLIDDDSNSLVDDDGNFLIDDGVI